MQEIFVFNSGSYLVLSYLTCNNCGNIQDILPFNYTRVPLSDYPGVPGSDYINANYIKGPFRMFLQFLSQAVTPSTIEKGKLK
jgi:protein tyrosine phosphatase